ncbi:MAG: hypothetical protein U9N42_07445 [Campylobacterota bacterium]|nr:hypothetical protein [Campylobacterota bacterium]
MRVILGSLILFVNLYASYEWSLHVNKKSVVQNESVEVTYEVAFSDDAYNYSIEFNPILKTQNYTLIPLSQKEFLRHNKEHKTYSFILQAKKSLDLNLSATILKISNKAAKEGTLGRDNDINEYINALRVVQNLPLLTLHVKETNEEIVGDFALHVELSQKSVNSYEPLHVTLKLSGVGNFNDIEPFALHVKDAKIYEDKIEKNLKLTSGGYRGEIVQRFAISSKDNFEIEPFTLTYYDLKTNKIRTIKTKPYKIEVKKAEIKSDLKEPKKESFRVDWLNVVNYIFTFIAGFLVAITYKNYTKTKKPKNELIDKIESCKTVNELHVVLISYDEKLFKELVESSKDFKTLKKDALLLFVNS